MPEIPQNTNQLIVYIREVNPRIAYIFDFLVHELIGLEVSFTTAEQDYIHFNGAKLQYGGDPVSDGIFIKASALLFEKNIQEQNFSTCDYGGYKAFFSVNDPRSAFPFDIFAASFFLLSRYEEYLPFLKDKFGRFHARESLPYKLGFLEIPVVNHWADDLGKIIHEKYDFIKPVEKNFRFIPTFDIDIAFGYKYKGFIRSAGAFLNDIYSLEFSRFVKRLKIISGLQKDPFDTFGYLDEKIKLHQLDPVFFILIGEYSRYDKNNSVNNQFFQNLLKSLGDNYKTGIHPSFASNTDFMLLQKEVRRLSGIMHREITRSRQHFLKLEIPATYRNLIELDISEDHTMGFAVFPGFRAGVCTPFPFFDLEFNRKSRLTIYPFTVMDGTLKDYMKLNPLQAVKKIRELIDQVAEVNGTFISLWHNESLSEEGRWVGWRTVFEEMLFYANQKTGKTDSKLQANRSHDI